MYWAKIIHYEINRRCVIDITIPPSGNSRLDTGKRLTTETRNYKDGMKLQLNLATPRYDDTTRQTIFDSGQLLDVHVDMVFRDNRRYDIDNGLKEGFDILQGYVYPNDKQIAYSSQKLYIAPSGWEPRFRLDINALDYAELPVYEPDEVF